MKRILLLCTVVLGAVAAMADATLEMQSPRSHDFGTVREKGGPVSCEFEFTNTGDTPLVIISATASCGCTQPKYTTDPVKPGQKGTIRVTYLPAGRPGEFDKSVKVRTNAKNAKKITLKIKGVVVP